MTDEFRGSNFRAVRGVHVLARGQGMYSLTSNNSGRGWGLVGGKPLP